VFIDVDETLALLDQAEAIRARAMIPAARDLPEVRAADASDQGARWVDVPLYATAQVRRRTAVRVSAQMAPSAKGTPRSVRWTRFPKDWDVALRVAHDGQVAQTAIRQWEQWGCSSADGRRCGADGEVKAMAVLTSGSR
jgi:hypothetical protein